MANTIILKRSATPGKVPTTAQLALGEIAINTYDGLIYIKKDDGTPSVVQIGGVTSVNGETGSVTITSDDVSDSGQTNKWASASVVRGHLSAGTGISYNSGTGVISTTQNLSTAGSPTFAGLTLTGNQTVTGDILPSADNIYSLGSASYMWKDVYVGPGSLYVNGQKVLEDNSGTITFSADAGQSLQIKTSGAGNVQLSTDAGGVIQVASTLQISSGKNITDSAGVEVNFGDNIDMNSNKIVGLGAPSANTDAATKGYVDTSVAAISTSSISQGNSNVSVVDSGTGTVTVTVDGSTALTVDANGVTVAGNFTVSGTQTTVNSNTIALADNIITLNSDHTGAPTQNAGILVERGDEADAQLRWNEGTDVWQFTNDGATYHPIPVTTDGLTEGSTNLYHTTARARGALSASSASGVSYNSTTGVISLGSIPNSSLTNNSITINGTAVALGGTRTLDSDAIGEGSTNLYHTTARARGAVSAGTGISYNSTTGVITNTITQYTDALARAAVSASGDLSYDSTTGAFSFTQDKAFSSLTGKPTSIAGYGITNAYTKTEVDSAISTAVAGKDNTDEITEGSTNLYFTNARARGAVSVTDSGGDGSLSYNSTTGVLTYTGPSASEVRAHFSAGTGITITSGAIATTITQYTDALARAAVSAGTGISYNSTTGVITNTITQYTDALARAAVSVTDSGGDGSLSYNSSTGVLTYTGPSAAEVRAHFSAGTGITITSGAIATTITQYTDALARASLSFTAGSGAYNSTTGVITIPTNTNQLTNGAGYVTSSGVTSVTGTAPIVSSGGATPAISISAATTSAAGSMSAADKSKLDGIASGATANTGTVTSVAAGSYLTGGTITTSGTLAVDATSANTASKVVARDASGNFSAGTITATLSGTATGLAGTPNITVGTITSGAIAATGSITATGEITAYFSDERLKTDINPIEGALDKVMAIGGYTYKANDLAHELGVERYDNQIGLLAQEVEAVMPELVTESGLAGYKTIRYDKVVSVLVQAIKEQQAMIEELRQEVKSSRTLH
jgi:hypothetical protein